MAAQGAFPQHRGEGDSWYRSRVWGVTPTASRKMRLEVTVGSGYCFGGSRWFDLEVLVGLIKNERHEPLVLFYTQLTTMRDTACKLCLRSTVHCLLSDSDD